MKKIIFCVLIVIFSTIFLSCQIIQQDESIVYYDGIEELEEYVISELEEYIYFDEPYSTDSSTAIHVVFKRSFTESYDFDSDHIAIMESFRTLANEFISSNPGYFSYGRLIIVSFYSYIPGATGSQLQCIEYGEISNYCKSIGIINSLSCVYYHEIEIEELIKCEGLTQVRLLDYSVEDIAYFIDSYPTISVVFVPNEDYLYELSLRYPDVDIYVYKGY